MSDVNRKPLADAAESKTLRMRGNSLRGNRETLETPWLECSLGRSEKAQGQTSDRHVSRESDDSIVPEKRANKAGSKAAAESVEGRGPTQGNDLPAGHVPDTEPGGERAKRVGADTPSSETRQENAVHLALPSHQQRRCSSDGIPRFGA